MSALLKIKGAFPYFLAVFLNAFVDLGHKIIIQNTIFKIYDGSEQVVLTAIVNALILLPFIVLFTPAGFISDKYPKYRVMKISTWAAVVLSLAITAFYYMGLFWLAFFMTLLLAAQSAFFSPAKYGYIKSLFGKERLARANGLAQSVSIIAILSGTFAFTILFEWLYPKLVLDPAVILKAIAPVGWLLVFNSLLQLYLMYQIPRLDKTDVKKQFMWQEHVSGKAVRQNIQLFYQRRAIAYAIAGLAMFWSVGQVLLAAYPAFAKAQLAISNTIFIQGILAGSGIGIAIGAAVVARYSRHHIEMGFVPVGALGIVLGLFMLPQVDTIVLAFIDFIFIGVMGGFFIVPLNALMQFHARENELGRVVATSNWVQNISMMSFLIVTVLFSLLGFSSYYLLLMISVVAVIGGVLTVYNLPQSLGRLTLFLIKGAYSRLRVYGVDNIPEYGGFLIHSESNNLKDWIYILTSCPRKIQIIIAAEFSQGWWTQFLLKRNHAIIVDESELFNDEPIIQRLLTKGEAVYFYGREQASNKLLSVPGINVLSVQVSFDEGYAGALRQARISFTRAPGNEQAA